MTKEIVEMVIQDMPDEFHEDDLFQRLYFIEEVEAVRKEIEKGKTFSHSEVRKMFEEWKKSSACI